MEGTMRRTAVRATLPLPRGTACHLLALGATFPYRIFMKASIDQLGELSGEPDGSGGRATNGVMPGSR